jgi:hypothetical protein
MYRILGDSSDGECCADLQKMLKMGIGILLSLPTEWALLHHIDQCKPMDVIIITQGN